jgi:uncharacterized protein (DUF4415 family)
MDAPTDIAEEIDASVPLVDDFPSPEELKRDLKRTITIRLDPEVCAWFQLSGPGYQTRINAVLRHYVARQKAAKAGVQPVILGHYATYMKPKDAGRIEAKSASKAASKAAFVRKPADKGAFVSHEKKTQRSKSKKARSTRA